MRKYDIISLDNRSQQSGYVKIGTFPLDPSELSNYIFPLNSNNICLDVYWFGNLTRGNYARFGIALKNSNNLNISQLSYNINNQIIENPIAYVRTTNGFDLYVRANSSLEPFLNVKCCYTETNETRFIPLQGNPIIDISNLNPTYFNPINYNLDVNTNIHNITNYYKYHGTSGTDTIQIPNYSAIGRYIVRLYISSQTEQQTAIISIINGNLIITNGTNSTTSEDNNIQASLTNDTINLSKLIYAAFIYYEIIDFSKPFTN